MSEAPLWNSEITEEQQKRIAANRENALKRKLEVADEAATSLKKLENDMLSCQYVDLATGSICGAQPVAKDLLLSFGESCCERCRHLTADYELINKSIVASQFLLPQDSIKMMKFVTKNNPRNVMFAPMKLYLRKHAMEKSLKRWGDADGLMKELDRREKDRFEQGLAECEGALDNDKDDEVDYSSLNFMNESNKSILKGELAEESNKVDGDAKKKGRKAKVNSASVKRSAQLSKMVLAIRNVKEPA